MGDGDTGSRRPGLPWRVTATAPLELARERVGPRVSEVVLAESIRSVTWANATKVVCGMNSCYVLVNVLSNEVEEIAGSGVLAELLEVRAAASALSTLPAWAT